MTILSVFVIGLIFSFLGSIPPGTINLSVMQMSIQGKKAGAVTFGLAAALVEFFYAGFAVRFQIFLTENIEISNGFKLISGSVLILLGILNLIKKAKKQNQVTPGEKRSGFLKGLLVGLANPLSIPFWLAVTAYLQSMEWLVLTPGNYLFYVAGISTGTILLLLLVIQFGSRFTAIQHSPFILYRIPGILFLMMGIWTFMK